MRRVRPAAFWLIALAVALVSCRKQDAVAPRVLVSYPAPGDSAIPPNVRLQVVFSEAMDQAAAEVAFHLAPADSGVFSWHGDSVLHFEPFQDLAPHTSYTMTVDVAAADLAGNPLDSAYQATFVTGDSASSAVMLYMLGRSVMAGWFNHWGGSPYTRGRFMFEYHEVQPPPGIVASVQAIVDSLILCDNPVLFFKLCFVDFVGGDSLSAQQNLDTNLAYVERVYDAVVTNRGLDLIVGNALPQVAASTDQWLVWNHTQYNQALADFAATHPRVRVFDLYGVLADSSGSLNPAYATSSSDSHPNDAGYTALDAALFPFLETYY